MLDYGIFLLAVLVLGTALFLLWRGRVGRPRSVRTRIARGAVCFGIALFVTGISAWKLSNARSVQLLGRIIPRVETAAPLVALTFDDGPVPGSTERVLDILEAADVRATFFLNGRGIEEHLPQARRIARAGHELGNHSYSHPIMLGLSQERIAWEIEETDRQIRRAGYEGPIHFRSPYGKKLLALPYYLKRTGRINLFWDVEPDSDPRIALDSSRIVEHVLERTRPGSIVLLHVMGPRNATKLAAVPGIIDGLRARGFRFVTVSELLTHSR